MSCAFILKIRLVEKYVILLYMTELTVQSDTKFAKVTKPENEWLNIVLYVHRYEILFKQTKKKMLYKFGKKHHNV